jgi:hypothetical protein
MAKEHGDSKEKSGGAESGQCECSQPGPDEIAKRARELWVARGMTHGHDVDDWLEAECELRWARHAQRRDTAGTGGIIVVSASGMRRKRI